MSRNGAGLHGYVCPLADADEPAWVGGKAHGLARMLRLGLPVPAGFVVTRAVFDTVRQTDGLGEAIAARCRHLDPRRPDGLRDAAAAACALVGAARIPVPVRDAVAALVAAWPSGTPLIVRSSAVGEDTARASFAGQLDSIFPVAGLAGVEAGLRACWASYWSERALFYQLARGIRLDGMGVVVQLWVPAALSGVLFTRAPAPAGLAGDEMLAEYCFGPGEALVSGRVTPGRVVISRGDLRWRHEAAPDQDRPADGGAVAGAWVAALGRAGLVLERELGGPQDVEWTVDGDGRLFLVQSRPITEPGSASAAPDGPMVRWSNANVSENFPDAVSPFLYSIAADGYTHYFRNLARAFGVAPRRIQAMEGPLRSLIGVHGGRIYYNLTSIHAVIRLAPFGDRLVEAFDHFVGAPGAATPGRGGRGPGLGWELARIAVKTTWQYLFLPRRIRAFEETVTRFAERTRPEVLAARALVELRDDLRAFMEIRCHRWTNASLADAASMVCYGALKRLLNRAFPDADQAALHNTLLKGLTGLVSSAPVIELWALSRGIRGDAALAALFATRDAVRILADLAARPEFRGFRAALDGYLARWGFRCSGELMLTTPGLDEDPAALVDLLRSYAGCAGPSPAEAIREQDAARRAETARVAALLDGRRLVPWVPILRQSHLFRLLLGWTQRAIAFRERARLKQALLYSRCRRIVLAIGERLVAQGQLADRADVFFLTHQELDALASGLAMFPYSVPGLVALRRQAHETLRTMSPADAFTLPDGGYLPDLPAPVPGRGPAAPAAVPGGADELAGVGACGGQVTARARVLQDVSESHLLDPGEILVTRQTDPGWAPVFFLVRGLVLERGGMLSHGAIVAREFGLPCVVDVRDATRRIAPGRVVSVDGDRGRVRLVG